MRKTYIYQYLFHCYKLKYNILLKCCENVKALVLAEHFTVEFVKNYGDFP